MEIQLQELLEQIKKEGVEKAEAEAAAILESAKTEAERIREKAKADAEAMTAQAREENERFVRVSEDAIRQAGRNALLSFRESVNCELQAIVGEAVTSLSSSEELVALIARALAALNEADEAELLMNDKDLAALEQALRSALKADDSFDGGFRIAVEKGRAYYDYSKDALIDLLASYLSPRVTALLKEAEEA